MDDSNAWSLEQIRAFLAGSSEVRFAGQRQEEVYGWVEQTLVRHQYASMNRPGKGLVQSYIVRMTGLSRAQVTRLITVYRETGRVKAIAYQRTRFATRYTAADVDLLAYVDKAHGNLSGPATRRILEREHNEYSQAAYQRLAAISVAHLYRLRNSEGYRKRNTAINPHDPRRFRSANDASHSRRDRPGICASTRYIRAIRMDAKGCITSTQWTR